ncbi:hypothetical protein MNEG_12675 [Monoraphidium neglectum]|uniref:mTERF domain-containing protein n=1 Tax=Monoraphidium neglectum TaxID=145388 RepID=A0A0D2KHK3_9CHLO|nr:hypothetical protein MNEG_12675 [Monoraphidium neglectum]KIY95288.1 hypothetical protein MNEG_12675 [Monoraphidium neglectum]|eukprot:XP_013894308.1 hypothetical protein MNEG_12675 [Monoraphidium neglectum]
MQLRGDSLVRQCRIDAWQVIQGGSDPVYVAAATYLKSIGFVNQAEVARVLDIATNPNSLFVQYNDAKRSRNASARELTVEDDMAPVVEYLKSRGLSTPEVVAVVAGHPPVLSYSVEERLAPFWDYMQDTVGLQDVGAVIAKRPSLLGLDLSNLEKIVGYLKSVDTPPETIVKYMMTSI